MGKIQAVALLVLFICGNLSVQSQTIRVLLTGPDTLQQGERQRLTIVAENVGDTDAIYPVLNGFEQVSGTSTQSQVVFSNGEQHSTLTISFLIEATEAGEASIPSVQVEAQEEVIYSEPIIRTVLSTPNYQSPKSKLHTESTPPRAPVTPRKPSRRTERL